MIKLTPSSIGVMVDTLRYSGRDRYIIFRMKTRLHFEPLNLFFCDYRRKIPLVTKGSTFEILNNMRKRKSLDGSQKTNLFRYLSYKIIVIIGIEI